MGTGNYICVTLLGGAPWGFTLREEEGDTYRPLLISQVEEGGRAFLAGVQEGDEVVSLNGNPSADLTLLRAFALIDTSINCLQLLLKRYRSNLPDNYELKEEYCGERDSSAEALKSTTLHIFSPKHRSQSPKELNISESQDKTYYGDLDSDIRFRKGHQLHAPSSGDQRGSGSVLKENDEEIRQCFSPGDVIELQLSLSKQTLDDVGSTSLGSARGIEGEPSNREALEKIHTNTTSHYVPCSVREPLGQHGVVLSSPAVLGQVEVILQQPAASGAGRGGPRISRSGGSQGKGEEGGGHHKGVPGSFTVSFEIPSEETTPAEELDSDSEGDRDKPNKHRPRHARLRRSESLSEKQVKEAKSKCKHIALLLTAAPPNPNNKGVLMFKKHRQRARKYTLVSYGTGEDQPEYSDEEDEEEGDNQATHTVKFTLVAPSDSDVDKDFLTNAHSSKAVLAITLDKGLLDIEKNLNSQAEMECLPETKGKGALMFAKRRQRMDEISAEHEELRRQGIPVEGGHKAEKKTVEQSYMQSTTEGHAYMDVNIHQQSQHQQQYRQYQDQEYYEQQQNYQQQCQQQQYDQQHYQQQQRYPQQQEYQQQQQQQYSAAVNGTLQHQTSEMHTSFSNRTAKPFSVQNMVATPYSPAVSGTSQDSVGQGEQIASRDERISTPAIRSGLLMDARKRSTGKPMFTFKEAPKVSPNPELLNLVNRSEKKVGGESGTEEDYLSLGAEACNFLQSARFKHKTPPPVAPKPMINPSSPPWSTQMEMTNQDMPQHAENSVSTPAVAPTAETTPAPEPEPTPAPAPVPPPPPPPLPPGAPAHTTTEEQHTWPLPEPESQHKPLQVTAQEESGHMNSTQQPEYVTTWPVAQTQAQQQPSANSWHSSHVQPQEPLPHTWTPQIQPSWSQSQGETQTQTPAQPSWAQPREPAQSEPQARSHWTHPHEQPHLQPIQSSWNQPEEPEQQPPQASWIQPSQTDTQHQPAWVQQPQQKSQAQPSWVQQPESPPQASWGQQPQYQAPQQAWPQAQALSQPQPSWISAQTQQQLQSSVNAWPPLQAQEQAQPQWIQTAQAQPQVQPQANLNTWAPGPSQAQSPPSWGGQHPEHGQHTRSSWAQEQNQTQQQTSWTPSVPPQSTAQPKLQPPTSQPKVNTWSPAQTPGNTWTPQPQQPPVNVSTLTVNPHPPPKSWHPSQHAPKTRTTPLQPQHLHSFTVGQRASSSINPMASVLIPSSSGSAYEMPAVRGKGADMFAKRQSRMEKFIVDSDTVQANRAGRPPSPAASLPNEWKYTSSAPGRSYSLSPPVRIPSTGQRSASFSPKPLAQVSTTPPGRQTSLEKGHKPLTPWEAASRHPLGLVDEAFTVQNFQQTLASNICLAAQRKLLPEPPVEWKPRVSHQAPKKTGSQTWSQSQSHSKSRAPLPSFMSPTKCTVSAVPDGYRSLPRQWQPQRPVTQEDLGSSVSSEHGRPLGKQTYKSVYTSNNWSWRR